jgi:hypothetical protein
MLCGLHDGCRGRGYCRSQKFAVLGLHATSGDGIACGQRAGGPTLRARIDTGIGVAPDALVEGGGAAYVRDHLARNPQVSADDRAKLVGGAVQSLDSTLRHLVDHNCRILLQSYFDEGVNRAWILQMIELGRMSNEARRMI